MKLVIFGLSISSSWGNGHATIWRGLCGALARQRHDVTFFERDVPYYAAHRDLQNSDDFDLVLSYTGGYALEGLQAGLGARRVVPLYGSVDPDLHKPVEPSPQYSADLSYLGTYAPDRQQALEQLFLEPARRAPGKKFVIG